MAKRGIQRAVSAAVDETKGVRRGWTPACLPRQSEPGLLLSKAVEVLSEVADLSEMKVVLLLVSRILGLHLGNPEGDIADLPSQYGEFLLQ